MYCMPPSSNTTNSSSVQEAYSNLRGQIMTKICSMDWFVGKNLYRKPGFLHPNWLSFTVSMFPETNSEVIMNEKRHSCPFNRALGEEHVDMVTILLPSSNQLLPAIKAGWSYPQFKKRKGKYEDVVYHNSSRILLFYLVEGCYKVTWLIGFMLLEASANRAPRQWSESSERSSSWGTASRALVVV